MRRTLAIGDVHGGYRALLQVLERAKVTPADRLIFLGDLVDGWSESYEVIDHLIALSANQACIFIKGNHDLYCEYWLSTMQPNPNWDRHGGKTTQEGYLKRSEEERQRHLSFFQKMKYYQIDKKNRLFIHAGFTSMYGPELEPQVSTLIWDRTLLEVAMATSEDLSWDSIRFPKRLKQFHEIFIGHTPTQNY